MKTTSNRFTQLLEAAAIDPDLFHGFLKESVEIQKQKTFHDRSKQFYHGLTNMQVERVIMMMELENI